MNTIYRDAAHVLVWLGLDTEKQAAPAFSLVRELDERLKTFIGDSPHGSDTFDLERSVRQNWKALKALTGRAWFNRGWIVQEIGTCTPATMLWGDTTMDWELLASVCERLKCDHHLRSTLSINTSDISFLFRRFTEPDEDTHHANRYNFVYELQRARHLRFSDDRDRVFAFLGHFSTHSLHPLSLGPVSIAADYTKTVEQTYINLAVQILRANPDAACILLAAVQHPRRLSWDANLKKRAHSRQSLPSCHETPIQAELAMEAWRWDKYTLPSWVPDWRWSEGIILAEPICPHRAHGDSTTSLEIVEPNGLMLKIYGVEIDNVEVCSQALLAEDFYNKTMRNQSPTLIEWLWKDICGKTHFNLDEKYLNDQTAFFAFMQTLSNGCVQAAGHECRPYHEIPDHMWLEKAARYVVATLGASGEVSEEIWRLGTGAELEGDHEKWSRWGASASEGRTFAKTEMGYYVLGPTALEVGDVVCVLFGSKVPFCLRPMGRRYLFVGECYAHGLMKGEAMAMLARDELHEKVFDIV
ncbi:hypothetical protein CGLO_16572 [Colletotrichum gloeosporioides Cg-14]|uniref:Heterokaryon incompatibility domain-containing protein n=1 Tax=Colletotrichum gloeosporioides (strain Cg-14) TaxID=1237896 RepID=T0JYT1_COLGC|nr:hypothetical protein CGLO_16572 [Colletotrichum gloeosporioides Cg-14]